MRSGLRRTKSAGLFTLVLAVFGIFPVMALDKAAEAAWKKDTQEARAALEKNQFNKANDLYEVALVEAEKFGPEDARVSETLNGLAFVRKDLGQRPGAEAALRRALTIDEKRLGTNNVELFGELLGIAELCSFAHRFDEAEIYFLRAQTLAEWKVGKFDRLVGVCLEGRAIAAMQDNRLEESEKLFKQALDLLETSRRGLMSSSRSGPNNLQYSQWVAPPNPSEVAVALNNMGLLYKMEKKYGDAETTLNRSLKLYEEQYGKKSLNLCNGLLNLAGVYVLEGKLTEAETLLQRSLEILKPADPNLPMTIQTREVLHEIQQAKSTAPPTPPPRK